MTARPRARLGARGVRHLGLAFLAGLAVTLALPPADLLPLAVVGFSGGYLLLARAGRPRAAFARGWAFGLGLFLSGLYWVSFSMLVDVAKYWWLMPLATLALPAVLALYPALAFLAWQQLQARLPARFAMAGAGGVVAFALLWSGTEWLRGVLFTGFPWHLAGYVWDALPAMRQLAALLGIHGVGLLTLLVATLPALFWQPAISWRRAAAWCGVALAGLGLGAGWGLERLARYPAEALSPAAASAEPVRLRLVQPNIAQTEKWKRERRAAHLLRLIRLSRGPFEAGGGRPDAVIWPETAIHLAPLSAAQARQAARLTAREGGGGEANGEGGDGTQADGTSLPALAAAELRGAGGLGRLLAHAVPPGGMLLTGAQRSESRAGVRHYFNSLIAFSPERGLIATYDKVHLVPFGEVTPFRWLPGVASLAAGAADFTAGPGPRTLDLPGLPPLSPLICYEDIFAGRVARDEPAPHWLLNVTNDAWFGRTAGPHQHFAIARWRALEEGVPTLRVANTGISAIFDPLGRVVARLDLGRQGRMDSILPMRLEDDTFYRLYGNWIYLGIWAGFLLFWFAFSLEPSRLRPRRDSA